jgi:S-adenosylmethionine decarboxylase
MERVLGKHYLVEFIGCDKERIERAGPVEEALLQAVEVSRATYIAHEVRQFEPAGVSAIVFIAESHFGLHTWPEYGYAGLDIFTCGTQMSAEAAIEFLGRRFNADETRTRRIERGL